MSNKELILTNAEKYGRSNISAFSMGVIEAIAKENIPPSTKIREIKEVIEAYNKVLIDTNIKWE